MSQLPRHFLAIVKIIATLLCIFAIPASHAHSGHHGDESEMLEIKGGDFTLTSAKGSVSLKDFRGKIVVIFFGYTHCEDVCPLTLGRLGSALTSMKSEELAQIQPIFITVDPARDDAKRMASFSESFHPKLIGLTGSEAEIATVAKAYGIERKKGPVNSAGGYDIDHPSVIYFVGRRGELSVSLPFDSSPKRIATVLRLALKS